MVSEPRTKHIVIGTAGHIDHGKTSLIKALTGRDLDKLDEEKRRGITIELGFAFYGDQAAFVDVPGHERLVKTMVAGAAAMRAALLVVAADDGVMPQTREHLAVLDALGVERGVVAITKADLVDDPDWIELVREEVRELLEPTSLAGSPIVVVDSLSGRGIDELRGELDRMIEELESPVDPGFFRLPIDRSFLIKGYGRVVTGTVWSGRARGGDHLVLLPGGETVRVRGLQAHEQSVDEVHTGDRAALNLATDSEPERGQVLFAVGRGIATEFLDASLSLLPGAREVRHRTRIRLHVGTGEVIGRILIVGGDVILPGTRGYVRIALEEPAPVMQGDRGVVRLYSPMETLGGVKILDPNPPDRRRTVSGLEERLHALDGSPEECVTALVVARGVCPRETLLAMFPWPDDRLGKILVERVASGALHELAGAHKWYLDPGLWEAWKTASKGVLTEFHRERPDEAGMAKAAWAERTIGREVAGEVAEALATELAQEGLVRIEGGVVASAGHKVRLRRKDEGDAARVHDVLKRAGINAPLPAAIAEEIGLPVERVRALLRALKQVGRVVILEEKVVVDVEAVEDARRLLREQFAERSDGFALSEAAEALGTTRKYAVPLLEMLDKEGFTVREGDRRRVTG